MTPLLPEEECPEGAGWWDLPEDGGTLSPLTLAKAIAANE